MEGSPEDLIAMEGVTWIGEDWDDSNEPLVPVVNEYKIDLEAIYRNRTQRRTREDNCKRKLCFSPQVDDGYGYSRYVIRRFYHTRRYIRARGKRIKKEDDLDESLDESLCGSINLSDGEHLGEEDASSIQPMDADLVATLGQLENKLKIV